MANFNDELKHSDEEELDYDELEDGFDDELESEEVDEEASDELQEASEHEDGEVTPKGEHDEHADKEGAHKDGKEKEGRERRHGRLRREREKVLAELEKAQAAAEDYKRKWYAVSAEYDNYRKRTQAASSQAYADGKAEAILKLLPVADTFGYALDGASDEKTKAGIEKVIKNFKTILSSLGVEEITIEVGSKFDESVAEAIMNFPCEEGEEPNTVKQVLKKGYKQGEKVIRFAQVTVTI